MAHSKNISGFLLASRSGTALTQAYCGLVAIELWIKHEVGLADHHVCQGLVKFRLQRAVADNKWKANGLQMLTDRLRADIGRIHVQGKDGVSKLCPVECYPYIRYTRLEGDGWAPIETSEEDIQSLAKTVQQLIAFLSAHFSFK